MVVTAEVDEAGRIVIPEKFHKALHLQPGSHLVLREEDGVLLLRPCEFSWMNGIPVFETGSLPADHVDWMHQNREERADELFDRSCNDE